MLSRRICSCFIIKISGYGSSIIDAPELQPRELIYKIYEATQVRYDKFLLEKFGHMYETSKSSSFYKEQIWTKHISIK